MPIIGTRHIHGGLYLPADALIVIVHPPLSVFFMLYRRPGPKWFHRSRFLSDAHFWRGALGLAVGDRVCVRRPGGGKTPRVATAGLRPVAGDGRLFKPVRWRRTDPQPLAQLIMRTALVPVHGATTRGRCAELLILPLMVACRGLSSSNIVVIPATAFAFGLSAARRRACAPRPTSGRSAGRGLGLPFQTHLGDTFQTTARHHRPGDLESSSGCNGKRQHRSFSDLGFQQMAAESSSRPFHGGCNGSPWPFDLAMGQSEGAPITLTDRAIAPYWPGSAERTGR